ncbi:hypothetical protein F6X39_07390 [Paraburkholderia sp. UCT2]|nr:hypothetical protein [Paraburkholderia sp. UCT2]
MVGATRIDNLDDQFFIVVRRALETDALQLVSFDKSMLFRLTDFVSEYDLRTDTTTTSQHKYFRPAHDILMKQKGFPELINTHN